LKILADHLRPVYALTFSPDGRWLGTGGGDGWMNIYSVKVNLLCLSVATSKPDASLFTDNQEEVGLVCWF
jgi:WD40 repeat protein